MIPSASPGHLNPLTWWKLVRGFSLQMQPTLLCSPLTYLKQRTLQSMKDSNHREGGGLIELPPGTIGKSTLEANVHS